MEEKRNLASDDLSKYKNAEVEALCTYQETARIRWVAAPERLNAPAQKQSLRFLYYLPEMKLNQTQEAAQGPFFRC
jgi:hypothetical protein